MSDVEIGNAIIAGIADGDTVLEKMSEIIDHLRLAGFEIVPVGGASAQRAPTYEGIRWQRVNDEPFEYAIQQGPHGDEFVKLMNFTCLRRTAVTSTERK